ncbi:hypothetical protein HPB48_017218 [Haemaphysalis longicornis]|uniref:Tick transposon n=1 Tax=Haemaphysalis longicornis TaxID=44386 RepID=A0A9J6GU67_HAELO|nr:hypothetical protein HPB48_017218 [Haemaphysalis longicornis]
MLRYLRRNFNQAPVSLKPLLYKVLVRSKLEYAASVWDPRHDSLIYELERVKNRAARFVLSNYHRHFNGKPHYHYPYSLFAGKCLGCVNFVKIASAIRYSEIDYCSHQLTFPLALIIVIK